MPVVRALPRLATVLVAVVLSLAVVIAPKGGRADAWANPIVPIAIGTELASAPAEGAVVGGLCATGVGCLAVGAVALGITLYATKDTWMPWVNDFFNQNVSTDLGGAAGPCPVQLSGQSVSGHTATATVVIGASCLGSTGSASVRLQATNLRCFNVASKTVYTPSLTSGSNTQQWGGYQTSGSITVDLGGQGQCNQTVGDLVRKVDLQGIVTTKSPQAQSNATHREVAVPASMVTTNSSVDCKRPNGTTFNLSGSDEGYPDRLAVPSCRNIDPTSVPTHLGVTSNTNPGENVVTWDAPASPDWQTQFPNCFGPSGLLCTIKVFVHGNPCEVGMTACLDWWSDRGDTSKEIECRFGTYVVPFTECEPLKRAYRTGTGTQTVTTAPAPGDAPWPDADPTTGTGTATNPIPSTGTNPATPGVTVDEDTDPDTQNCFKAAWSWNPVDWVYVPVKCALKWAFVPKVAPSFSDVPSPLPAGWVPSMPNISGGCGPLTFPQIALGWKGWTVGPVDFMSTCDPPWPSVRVITYNGALAMVLVSVVWTAFRVATNALGMGVLSSGGEDE